MHTAWFGKYTSVIYSADDTSTIERFERQPLPDYLRWISTCELHYLNIKNRFKLNRGVWDEISGLYIPNLCLTHCTP